jgi:hypothetical protein
LRPFAILFLLTVASADTSLPAASGRRSPLRGAFRSPEEFCAKWLRDDDRPRACQVEVRLARTAVVFAGLGSRLFAIVAVEDHGWWWVADDQSIVDSGRRDFQVLNVADEGARLRVRQRNWIGMDSRGDLWNCNTVEVRCGADECVDTVIAHEVCRD